MGYTQQGFWNGNKSYKTGLNVISTGYNGVTRKEQSGGFNDVYSWQADVRPQGGMSDGRRYAVGFLGPGGAPSGVGYRGRCGLCGRGETRAIRGLLIHPIHRFDTGMKANAVSKFKRLFVEFLVCDKRHITFVTQRIFILRRFSPIDTSSGT